MHDPEFIAEIRDRICLDEFGEETEYSGATQPVIGIFDATYVRVEAGRAGVQSQGPAVFYQLDDLPSDPQDVEPTQIVIRGIAYKVIEVRPDGQGGVVLRLQKKP